MKWHKPFYAKIFRKKFKAGIAYLPEWFHLQKDQILLFQYIHIEVY